MLSDICNSGRNFMRSILSIILNVAQVLAVFIGVSLSLAAQENTLVAKYIEQKPNIDGVLDEDVWSEATYISNFWQFFPNDSIKSEYPTEVAIVYDNSSIYIAAKAESINNDYVVSTLRRDFGGTTNDNITFIFDTFNDGTNAFAFGVTPYGVKRDILISNGGAIREGFNVTWDVKWKAEAKINENSYTVEAEIPLTSLKFKEGETRWRFRAYRWDIQTNEQSTWIRVPQTQLLANLAFMGDLIFEKPLPKSRTPFAIIPYANGLTFSDNEAGIVDAKLKIGGDAKIAIGDGLNLDLTVNPDFSNVEVDDIFTNLTRFELRLPERRQFFIDNSDLFASFGNTFNEARPFFSRRIGLARDTVGNLIQNDIIGGVRLSGKLNEDWRIGVLNLQTNEDQINLIPSNNNMMLAFQRKIAKRSNLGAFLVNRQSIGEYDYLSDSERYNRVVGIDYNLASADNVWSGRFYVHNSISPEDTGVNLSSQAMVTYNKNNWVFTSDWVYVDNEFRADLGFVPRTDIFKAGNFIQRFINTPKNNLFNRHNFQILNINYWRPTLDFKFSDYFVRLSYEADFKSQAKFTSHFYNQFIFLTNDFDPTRSENGVPLPGNNGYTYNYTTLEYSSNNTSLFTYSLNSTIGQFFNGNRYSIGSEIAYRIQPKVRMSLNMNYDAIRLPEPHADADLWLVSPRFDITFSKAIFWTTIVQYSNQRKNLGLNTRLQWRFAPLSDLFIVYNDNYYTDTFDSRFRSINLKITYWLNL